MPRSHDPQVAPEQPTSSRVVQIVAAFVVVLVAALVAMGTMSERTETGKRHETIQRMQEIEDGLARYMVDSGGILPSGTQGLRALLARPTDGPRPANWDGPYISGAEMLRDAWGNEFQYVVPGRLRDGYDGLYHPYSLWSYGADGAEGGDKLDADICSWDRTTMIP